MKALAVYWSPHEDYVALMGGAKRWLSTFIFAMEAFGFDTLFVVGTPGITHGYSIQHEEVKDISEILMRYSEANVVAMVGSFPEGFQGEILPLTEYSHPLGDTIYVIGGDYEGIEWAKMAAHGAEYVTIDNKVGQCNFWSFSVAAILMRDFYNKQ